MTFMPEARSKTEARGGLTPSPDHFHVCENDNAYEVEVKQR